MAQECCLVCDGKLSKGHQSWHFICKNCGYEHADLTATINQKAAHQLIDEQARETGLRTLRIDNFKDLVNRIRLLKPVGGRLLDVGCAHGWFLEAAKNDFEVSGIEPDENLVDVIVKNNVPVRKGYFPEALQENEQFDVITFNDVMEHIPDIKTILESCKQSLNKEGLLVLNLPSSNGIFYKLSKWFCRLGFPSFFERLWQKGLPSPHLHYFNSDNLKTLLERNGFEIKESGSMPTIRFAGLYSRISYTGNLGLLARLGVYIGVLIFLPVLNIVPRDAIYIVSTRK